MMYKYEAIIFWDVQRASGYTATQARRNVVTLYSQNDIY